MMGLIGGAFAIFVIPGLEQNNLLVQVISSPAIVPETQLEVTAAETQPLRVAPLPKPPVQKVVPPSPPMPTTPFLTVSSETNTDFLVDQTENALEIIAQVQAEEEQRLKELFEKEERERKIAEEKRLLAQQKAAEEEAERKKQAAERALVAQKEAARKARERAIVAQETEARRAQERAIAARETEARRAQEAQQKALAAQQQQARQAAAQAEAQAQATAAARKKIASTPVLARRTTPKYPSKARREGVQGTTRIEATVTSAGKVRSPRIIASSGNRSLDSSALSAVKKWRFQPAKNSLGEAISHQVTIPVTFRLN